MIVCYFKNIPFINYPGHAQHILSHGLKYCPLKQQSPVVPEQQVASHKFCITQIINKINKKVLIILFVNII